MLAVESRTALVFGGNNPLNRCEVKLAECVVLATEETSPTFKGASRIDPNLHDPPAYERLHPLGSVPSMKQQSVHVVRSIIYGNLCKWHWESSARHRLSARVFFQHPLV